MKAEELMIGDYIKHGFGGIGKVTELSKGIVTVYDKGLDDGEGNCEVNFAENEIQPIPLTLEILEKNGWEERPTGYVFYTDGKRYDNSLWYIFGSSTFVVDTAEFQIKYVHELQHALRLCGISKEIIL